MKWKRKLSKKFSMFRSSSSSVSGESTPSTYSAASEGHGSPEKMLPINRSARLPELHTLFLEEDGQGCVCAELEIELPKKPQRDEIIVAYTRYLGALAESSTVGFTLYTNEEECAFVTNADAQSNAQPAARPVEGPGPHYALCIGAAKEQWNKLPNPFTMVLVETTAGLRIRLQSEDRVLSHVAAHHLVRSFVPYLRGEDTPSSKTTVSRWTVKPVPDYTKDFEAFDRKWLSYCARTLSVPSTSVKSVLPAPPAAASKITNFIKAKPSYIQHTVFSLSVTIDTDRLAHSWQRILRRHDATRTVFIELDREPVSNFALCVLDSSKCKDTIRLFKDIESAKRAVESHLDIHRPLVALSVIQAPVADKSRLMLTTFQGLLDSESLRLLQAELIADCQCFSKPIRTELDVAIKAASKSIFGTEEVREYWERYLDGFDPEPFPCLSGQSPNVFKNVTLTNSITSSLRMDAVIRRCQTIEVSPLAVLQAAWAVLLSAYSESMALEVMFGCVRNNRTGGLKECIGPLSSVVPVRVNLQEVSLISELLGKLDSDNIDACACPQAPLQCLVTREGREYYDTMVDFDHRRTLGTTLWKGLDDLPCVTECVVAIKADQNTDGYLRLTVTFKDTHLTGADATAMLYQLDDFISYIIASPDRGLFDLFGAVRPTLSATGNPRPIENNESQMLHSQFEEWASRHPQSIALIYRANLENPSDIRNIEWTYSELNSRANTVASHLVKIFGPLNDVAVPICIEKSPELYIAILAILKAGGGWCPIGVDFPVRRRHDLILRTGAQLLLVAGRTANLPIEGVPPGIRLVSVEDALNLGVDMLPKIERNPSNLAYLIWTSGTTGPPKGVPIEHRSGVASMVALQETVPTDVPGGVRCLQFAAYTFDVFVQDLFYAWGVGGTLISSTHEIMIGSMAALASATGATHAHLTPAYAAGVPRKTCHTLKVVTMIGERLGEAVARDWAQDMRAYNTYGPAEATVVSTVRRFRGAEDDFKSHNVGFPLPTVSCYCFRSGILAIKGGVGELALGGPHLARGYLNDPVKTNQKFILDENLGERVYLTGDIVRFLHNGTIEFVGRKDDQVKLGGIRIELSEISAAITSSHPLVQRIETMHICRPDRPTKVLVTFLAALSLPGSHGCAIVTPTAVEIARAAVKAARKELPEFMVPGVFVVINRIPVTPSNKIDREALRSAYASLDMDAWETALSQKPEVQASSVLTEGERVIAELVARVSDTQLEAIRATAGLRALGIDSIRAIQLTSALNEKGYKVSMVDVLSSNTIAELAGCVTPGGTTHVAPEAPSKAANPRLERFHNTFYPAVCARLHGLEVSTVLPTTPLQDGLLSETIRKPDAYWSNSFFALQCDVDISRLKKAWAKATAATEALRVGFLPLAVISSVSGSSNTTSAFLQVLYKSYMPSISVIDVAHGSLKDAVKARALKITTTHDLINPPWSITLFTTQEASVMMLTLHHAIHDGPSLKYLAADVQAAYLGYKIQPRTQLSEAIALTIPSSEEVERENIDFWEKELKEFIDPEGTAWPDLTGGKPLVQGERKHYRYRRLDLSASPDALSKVVRELGASSAATLVQAAWGSVLADYLELPGVVLGETLSSRIQSGELSDAIAPLVNVLPFPARRSGSARQIIREQSERTQRSLRHRYISPSAIRKALQRPRDQPLYPATYVFHPAEDDDDNIIFAIWQESPDLIGLSVEHPLALNLYSKPGDGLKLEASADSETMGVEHLDLLIRQVDALVSAMVMEPDTSMAQLANLYPAELLSIAPSRAPLIVRSSYTDSPTKWVEHFAKEHPRWVAVEVANEITHSGVKSVSWDYATLNAEANRIANFIAFCGIRKRMIAVCVSRTLAAYATILGVIKSGNTYLPVDEALPVARKVLLVEDSDTAILFTTSNLASSFHERGVPEGCKLICVDNPSYTGQIARFAPENVAGVEPSPNDPVYLLYTSGSTGKPKGVIVTRGNLSGFTEALSDIFYKVCPATPDLGGVGKYLGLASRAFDVHIAEMFLAWRHGLAAVTAARSMLLDDLGLALQKLRVTHASFVPSLLDQAELVPSDVPTLKYLSVGGEKISQRVLDTWAANDDVALVNAYGPTEVTICCSALLVTPEATIRNIGHLLGNITGYVFIPGTIIPAKRGQPGELCITGDLVALGYHNRHDAGGFCDYNGERLYRTGDIVRMMHDESIEYLGRSDDQAKIRGQRLELGEVSEGIRASCCEPLDVASLVVKHTKLNRPQLVSFVARATHRAQLRSQDPQFIPARYEDFAMQLQEECRKKLPAYMVPDIVLPVTFMPLAPMSGKADAKKLRALFSQIPLDTLLRRKISTREQVSSETRELTPREKKVRDALLAVVPFDESHITHSSSVFEFGIDSLSAIALSIRLKALGINASVLDVMTKSTIEELALDDNRGVETLEGSSEANTHKSLAIFHSKNLGAVSEGLGVPKSNIDIIMPCLPLQEGIVARSLSSDIGPTYTNHVLLQLSPSVDARRLKRSWEDTIKANPILRTCFCQPEENILQVVLSIAAAEKSFPWKESTVEQPVEHAKMERLQTAAEIVSTLYNRPPYRLHLLKSTIPTSSCLLSVSIHHSLYDGESFSMLLEEVYDRYNSKTVAKRQSFESFVSYVTTRDLNRSRTFWTDFLKASTPTLVASKAGYRDPDSPTSLTERKISTSLSALSKYASSLKVTVPSITQTLFGLFLAQHVGFGDVIFGSILSGRTVPVPGVETILAPCITTIPFRVSLLDWPSQSPLKEIIRSTHRHAIDVLEWQHTSLRNIQRWVGAEQPLFDCLFSYVSALEVPQSDLWPEVHSSIVPDYPFAVEVGADSAADSITVRTAFTQEFGSRADVDAFLENMDILLDILIKGEDIRLENLGIPTTRVGAHRQMDSFDESSWTTEEEVIRGIVAKICDIPGIEIKKSDSFFRLGIDSVTAIRLGRELKKAGIAASSTDIIRYSSIGSLANTITLRRTAQEGEAPRAVFSPDGKTKVPLLSTDDQISATYDCTPLQTGMLTQTLASDGRLYVHHHAIRLDKRIDHTQLKRAWEEVVRRIDILRTSFHSTQGGVGGWIAAVHKNPPSNWINEPTIKTLDTLVEQIRYREASDFHAPPAQARVLKQMDGSIFVVTMHHALYDGASIRFIFQDLETAYRNTELPQRKPFAEVVRALGEDRDSKIGFWLRNLKDYTPVGLPQLPPPERRDVIIVSSRTLSYDTSTVIQCCKSLGATFQTVALLAYAKVLFVILGRRDVVFGHVLAGRSAPIDDVENVIGPLFNTVPFRLRLKSGLQSNTSILETIQKFTAESQEHQHVPLRQVQREWRAQVNTIMALFNALLVFQISEHEQASESVLWTPLESDGAPVQSEYDINLEIEQGKSHVTLRAGARGLFFTERSLCQLLRDFEQVIGDILKSPRRSVLAFPQQLRALPLEITSQGTNCIPEENIDAETTPTEKILQNVMGEVAGVPPEQVVPDANIFSFGLDSITAITLASKCRQKGLDLGVSDILQGGSLRGICKLLQKKRLPASTAQTHVELVSNEVRQKSLEIMKLDDASVEAVLPLLPGQLFHLQEWLRSCQTRHESIWAYVALTKIDIDRLRTGWRELRKKHAALRTVFCAHTFGEVVQIALRPEVVTDSAFSLKTIHTSFGPGVEKEIRDIASDSSDMFTPPVRMRVVRFTDKDAIFITLHHAVYDGWSIPIIIEHLMALYQGRAVTPGPSFPSFVEYVLRNRRLAEATSYWRSALLRAERTVIATSQFSVLRIIRGAIPNFEKLDGICRRNNVVLHSLILHAIGRVLAEFTNTKNPVFGLYQTGRSASFDNLHKLCGPTLNVTPLCVHNAREISSHEGAAAIRQDLAQRIPYEQSFFGETGAPELNIFVNLLWHTDNMALKEEDGDTLLKHVDVGDLANFTANESQPRTAIDLLVPKERGNSSGRVLIDVGPSIKGEDCIDFGVRSERAWDAEEIEGFVGKVTDEVIGAVGQLEG